MGIDTQVTVDAESVIKRLESLSTNVGDQMVDALNKAAFQLRKKWRDSIATEIAKPTPFTLNQKNVEVTTASISNPESIISVAPIQAAYLQFIVEGLKRQGGDVATIRGETLSPVKAKLTRSGDLPQGPARWLGTLKQKIPKAFVKNIHGRRAVYQRTRGEGLKLLAVFQKSIQYKPSLPLYDIADAFGNDFVRTLNERVNKLLK